jgi:hypothetical protein
LDSRIFALKSGKIRRLANAVAFALPLATTTSAFADKPAVAEKISLICHTNDGNIIRVEVLPAVSSVFFHGTDGGTTVYGNGYHSELEGCTLYTHISKDRYDWGDTCKGFYAGTEDRWSLDRHSGVIAYSGAFGSRNFPCELVPSQQRF